MNATFFALVAIIPALIGPLPQDNMTLTAELCGGDSVIEIEIPISDDDPDHDAPCHGQGCHAGACRKQFDRDQ